MLNVYPIYAPEYTQGPGIHKHPCVQVTETEAQLGRERQSGQDLRSEMADAKRAAADKVGAQLCRPGVSVRPPLARTGWGHRALPKPLQHCYHLGSRS